MVEPLTIIIGCAACVAAGRAVWDMGKWASRRIKKWYIEKYWRSSYIGLNQNPIKFRNLSDMIRTQYPNKFHFGSSSINYSMIQPDGSRMQYYVSKKIFVFDSNHSSYKN